MSRREGTKSKVPRGKSRKYKSRRHNVSKSSVVSVDSTKVKTTRTEPGMKHFTQGNEELIHTKQEEETG